MSEPTIAETRAKSLINYLYDVIEIIKGDVIDKEIKADFLDNDINSYSLDKLPLDKILEKWVNGVKKCQDTYNFRSRFTYSSSQADELENVGFFEKLENLIYENNKNGVLPEIEGIESIECLNCGSLNSIEETTCEMNIQIRIVYIENK